MSVIRMLQQKGKVKIMLDEIKQITIKIELFANRVIFERRISNSWPR